MVHQMVTSGLFQSLLTLLIGICLPLWTVGRECIDQHTWAFLFARLLHFLWQIYTEAFWFIHLFSMTLANVTQSPESDWLDDLEKLNCWTFQVKLWIDNPIKIIPSRGRPCLQSQPTSLFEVVHLFLPSWEGKLWPSRTLNGAVTLFSLFLILSMIFGFKLGFQAISWTILFLCRSRCH